MGNSYEKDGAQEAAKEKVHHRYCVSCVRVSDGAIVTIKSRPSRTNDSRVGQEQTS